MTGTTIATATANARPKAGPGMCTTRSFEGDHVRCGDMAATASQKSPGTGLLRYG
jgi:hypothetical protein